MKLPVLCFFALGLTAAATLFTACGTSPTGPAPTPTPVPPVFTGTATLSPTITSTGTPSLTPTAPPTTTVTVTVTATPTLSATPTLTSTPTVTATVTNTPCVGKIFGETGNACDNGDGTSIYYFGFQAAAPSTIVSQLSAWAISLGAGYYFEFGVYSDNGSQTGPANLLGSTALDPYTTTGSAVISDSLATPVTLTAGTYYWLAFHANAYVGNDCAVTNSYVTEIFNGANPFPSASVPGNRSVVSAGANYSFWAGPCP